jgi:sorbitol-specific phosphotransferase system component IIC
MKKVVCIAHIDIVADIFITIYQKEGECQFGFSDGISLGACN